MACSCATSIKSSAVSASVCVIEFICVYVRALIWCKFCFVIHLSDLVINGVISYCLHGIMLSSIIFGSIFNSMVEMCERS